MAAIRKLWIAVVALAMLAILSPLGLLLPGYFKAKGSWGEWGVEDLRGIFGHVPAGLAKLSCIWHAPLAGYSFPGRGGSVSPGSSLTYIVSALAGAAAVAAIILLLGRIVSRKDE